MNKLEITGHIEDSNIEVESLKKDVRGQDKAAALLEEGEELLDVTDEEVKRIVRKVDWSVIPFIAVCYVFYYVDKTTLSYAAIFNMNDDLNLKGTEYSWLSSIFYFGWMAWCIPTNIMLLKFPVAKYLGFNVFLWGAFLIIQAACNNFATLCVVRALSGAAEAVSDPAFMLITSIWYTRREQPLRIGAWYTFNGLGIAVGGLIGYGIGHIQAKMPSWKYEFVIVGTACAIWGIIVFLFMPNSPVDCKFLNEREKKILLTRLKANQTGVESKVFKWDQVRDAFSEPKIYIFFFLALVCNLPNGGISNYGTLIIQGFGFSRLVTTLMQVPYGAVISFSIILAVILNDKWGTNNRRAIMICIFVLPNITGSFGLYFLDQGNKVGRLIFYYLTGPYNAAFVLILSITTANTAGHTKKILTNAFAFLGVCVGNIAGPFFYLDSQKPKYSLGMGSMIFANLAEIAITMGLGLYLRYQNKKRDRIRGAVEYDLSNAFRDMTDTQNKHFRYIY